MLAYICDIFAYGISKLLYRKTADICDKCLFHVKEKTQTDRQAGRQAGATKLIVAFWNLAKAPNEIRGLWVSVGFRQFAEWHPRGRGVAEL
jgi:hypothetical protein